MDHAPKIAFGKLDDFYFDPKNPRLGRHMVEKNLSQALIFDQMTDWALDELAVSFLESGFWAQEPLIVVKEDISNKNDVLVVIEGNRRLAALKMIQKAKNKAAGKKWQEIVQGYSEDAFSRLRQIPYIQLSNRGILASYLGFRHVSGIKEWNAAEKAQFIAHLIEDKELSYDQVRKRIGSKLKTVRQTYVAYRLLLQIEDEVDEIDNENFENRFSVLNLSLRTKGVRDYLGIDLEGEPKDVLFPVKKRNLDKLIQFSKWLFGTEDKNTILEDSRDIDRFGQALENKESIEYLERSELPQLSVAIRMSGDQEEELSILLSKAADEVEEALKTAHLFKKSKKLQIYVKRLGLDVFQLVELFPETKKDLFDEK